jgi:hypothetical protein
MFWRRGYTLRGEVGGGWALEFPSFLGPVKWHRANRRVPFGSSLPLFGKLIGIFLTSTVSIENCICYSSYVIKGLETSVADPDQHLDPLVTSTDLASDPSIIKQK